MVTDPMGWFHRDMPDLVTSARDEVARFFGAEPSDVACVTNVSSGVWAVLASLQAEPGDQVLSTNHIYGTVSLAIDRFCERTGATRIVTDIAIDDHDNEIVEAFATHCSERTALVVVDHITSSTAKRFPVEAVAAVAHRHGAPVIVDGAHAPGMLPVDIPSVGADFWVGNLHKWPCAPAGTAVLWVAPPWRERIRALVVSAHEPLGFPASFERAGTNDLSA
jgi:isopenicillin-N epimerase